MNEIEKIYEKFGIEKEYECNARFCYGELNACPLWCKNCENLISFYPPFTSEKQLKLIKWLFDSICLLCLSPLQNSENFENSLAELVNSLWQDLTEEHKQQIKEILE